MSPRTQMFIQLMIIMSMMFVPMLVLAVGVFWKEWIAFKSGVIFSVWYILAVPCMMFMSVALQGSWVALVYIPMIYAIYRFNIYMLPLIEKKFAGEWKGL